MIFCSVYMKPYDFFININKYSYQNETKVHGLIASLLMGTLF